MVKPEIEKPRCQSELRRSALGQYPKSQEQRERSHYASNSVSSGVFKSPFTFS